MQLPAHIRSTLAAIAEVAVPAGSRLPAAGYATALAVDRIFTGLPVVHRAAFLALASSADLLAWKVGRRSLEGVAPARRLALLEDWRTSGNPKARLAFRALMAVIKGAHFANPEVYRRSGCRLAEDSIHETAPRWLSQVQDLAEGGPTQVVEAEVVVIGTGAGGAAAARELATRGVAVAMLEAGPLHRRSDYVGSILARSSSLYASFGLQTTLGTASIFLPTGESVGGTTVINAGTCLRTPPWVLKHWREAQGIPLAEADLEPFFQRVESWLDVALPDPKLLGVPATIIARGADALGIAHGPLRRNAPGCDAHATCCFGCPTGAKRSADVALIPAALQAGAVLFTHARVQWVERKGRVSVVHAVSPQGRRLEVRASHVIFAAGALRTPLLLRRGGVSHAALGHNLSIHPAAGALGIFPFDVGMDASVPQGYGLEGLREQGLLFETAGLPFEVLAISLHQIGPRYVELLEQYKRILAFGFNLRETSRGRVAAGPRGVPLAIYSLNQADLSQFEFGLRVLWDVLFHGGASIVIPGLSFADEIPASVGSRALDGRHLAASDMDLSAYHPLGTARMGTDAATSVVDLDLRVRDAPGWLVCDGSVVPGSIGANPQITIMTLALRAASALADRLGN